MITQFMLLTLAFTRCYVFSTRFFYHWIMYSPIITRTPKVSLPKQGDHREKYYLLFLPFECVRSKQYHIGRISVKKPNHSSWQNAEVCRSHCRHDIKLLLLSLWQLFCRRIANWKILNLRQHFIANVLSTWSLKTVAVPKQGELLYYRLQITYSNWVFSAKISSI